MAYIGCVWPKYLKFSIGLVAQWLFTRDATRAVDSLWSEVEMNELFIAGCTATICIIFKYKLETL